MKSDVLIIGGGVIGLSIARELQKYGAGQITIVERGETGRESSWAAAGMLAPNAETHRDDDFYRFCLESNRLYPEFAAELLDETGIDVELDRSGTLYLAFTESDASEISERYEWQHKSGLNVLRLTASEIRMTEPFVSPDVHEGLFFPDDWQVENRKLLQALKRFAELNGIKIVNDAEIKSIKVDSGRATGAASDRTEFDAAVTVLATGAWTSFISIDKHANPINVKPMRGQMGSFRTAKRLFQRVIYSPRGYLVPRADGRILVGATVEDAGYDKRVTEAGLEYLRATADEIAPTLASLRIDETWAGLRPYAADGLPVIGEFPGVSDLYVATGHFRNGILLAPLTAKMVAESIMNGGSQYQWRRSAPQIFHPAAGSTR
ncbi:MAG: glycine oxidase ThiO [Pyrinomonadaceae bacterium]